MDSAIIYNVTTKVDHSIASDWLRWIKEEHIAAMLATGCFTHAVVLRMIETDETDGPTFAVQYHAPSKALYNRYISEFSNQLRQASVEKWNDRIISFRSVLQVVN
jgi:hypothetical protein